MRKLKHTFCDGAYTLPWTAEPLLNPAADGRTRNDWRTAPTFEPGTYFVTTYEHDEVGPDGEDWSYTTFGVHKGSGSSIRMGAAKEDGFAEFLDALVVDDSLASFVRYSEVEHYVCSIDVLMRLVEAGVVSDDAVRVAVAAQRQADQSEVNLEAAMDRGERLARELEETS